MVDDSLTIVSVRIGGWLENTDNDTDFHTQYRVEAAVRRGESSSDEVVTTYSRYRSFAALHAELARCLPGDPRFAKEFPVPKLVFHHDAAKRERADALAKYLNEVEAALERGEEGDPQLRSISGLSDIAQ